ncbi:MAG: protein kinase [candidate division Zixibacteria bacterium]|nr:protein kinase [candidate division Zixibacteria bacterium]
MILTKGTMVAHYRIVEKIGAGGMGEVYLAEDTKLKRKVALKFLPPHLCQNDDCRERFKREAQATAKLNHPNIVTIHEVGECQGRPFFAMEHVEGKPLRSCLKEQELDQEEILDLTLQICEGLNKAHEMGITHRDVKPSNIVIDADGRPKLLDFGLAAIQGVDRVTKTGSTLGTIGYMSPEQIQAKEVDQRSDLFSLGVVLYEMVTGRLPFVGDHEAAVMNAVLNEAAEPLSRYKSEVVDGLQNIVSKLLEKDRELRYQTTGDVISDLKRLRRDSATSIVSHTPRARTTKTTRYLVPALFIIIVAIVLILKPWQFEVRSTHEAVADDNRLAIMYFDNLADPTDSQKLGEIATNLLITDLSESRYIQVVSSQRLYDILKMLGREGEKKIDPGVASQIAKKAKATWMLQGSILRMEPKIELTAHLVEVSTGNAVASQRITGEQGETIFTVVDKLTVDLRDDLSLPDEARAELDRPVADVTTRSPEAYRYYLEGVDYGYKHYFSEARQSLKKAVELDSTFAMAYFRLAGLSSGAELKEYRRMAMKYSEKASHKERSYILCYEVFYSGEHLRALKMLEEIIDRYPDDKEAYYFAGVMSQYNQDEDHKAIEYFRKAIEIDSLYGTAYNSLAYSYNEIGDLENSIWAINRYIELAPDEANPYDTRADLYARNGELEKAIESYEKALEIKPDFHSSRLKLAYLYLFARRYDIAEKLYRGLCSDSNANRRSLGRLLLTYIPIYQGRLDAALKTLDDMVIARRVEQDKMGESDFHLVRASIFEEKNELETALTEMEKATEEFFKTYPDERYYSLHIYIRLLAENAHFEKARSECEMFRDEIERHDSSAIWTYWFALGCVEFAQENYEESIARLEKAAENEADFSTQYMLGRAYLMSGRLGESVNQFESTLNRYEASRAGSTIWSVKIHYYLGQAYEASGWNKKAIEQYETFLDIWKDADEGLKSVEDAKERLARLKNES